MSLAATLVLLSASLVAGSRDGVRAAGLAFLAGLGGVAVRRVAERTAGPVGAYALVVGVRAGAIVGGGTIVIAARLADDRKAFWLWLLAAYLAALVSETVTAVRQSGRKG